MYEGSFRVHDGRWWKKIQECQTLKLGDAHVHLMRPKSITILYCDFTLFIDIFHFKVLFLCCFGLFYTVCNFRVLKQQNQDSTVKTGHQVAKSEDLQISWNLTEVIFRKNYEATQNMSQRGATRFPGPHLARPLPRARQAPFWLPGGSPHLLLRWLPVNLHKNASPEISSHLDLILFSNLVSTFYRWILLLLLRHRKVVNCVK